MFKVYQLNTHQTQTSYKISVYEEMLQYIET